MYNLNTKANIDTPLKKLINKISYRILALFCTCIGAEIKDEVRGEGKELNVHDQLRQEETFVEKRHLWVTHIKFEITKFLQYWLLEIARL